MFFALNIFFEAVSPTVAFALTGGPSQPEVQSFTPVGTSDMVNVFSGDFNYNIPLLDVDGYPINLAYNAGVSNDQEASWVGLGWNINPGTVNRGMRGMPDDFDGDVIHKETNSRPNQTFGVSVGLGFELFGKDPPLDPLTSLPIAGSGYGNLHFGLGLNYNTYNGYGMDLSAKLSLAMGKNNSDGFSGSLGLNSGTGRGLGISADLSYAKKNSVKDKYNRSYTNSTLNTSLGLNYNTSSGLNSLTFSSSVSRQKYNYIRNSDGAITGSRFSQQGSANGGFGYSFASPTYMPSSGPEMVNLGLNVSVSFGTALFGSHPKATLSGYYSGQFIKDKTKDYLAYGYLHSDKANDVANNILHDFNREKDNSFTLNTPNLPVTNYTYDSYAYTGQGISGDFRPHRNHVGTVFDPTVKNFPSMSSNVGIEIGAGNALHGGLNVEFSFSRTLSGKWVNNNQTAANSKFQNGSSSTFEGVYFQQGGEKAAETDMNYFNNVINGFDPVRFSLTPAGAEAIAANELVTKYGAAKAYSNNARSGRVNRNESVNVLTGTQASYAGVEKSIKNYSANDWSYFYTGAAPSTISRTSITATSAHHISEITTLRDDGARYVYGIPVYNHKTEESTFAVQPSNVDIDYANGLAGYNPASENSIDNSSGLDHYFDKQEIPGYAHAFLLNAVLSADYVDRTQDGPTRDDFGKYTKINYTKVHSDYKWRTPYGENKASINQGLYSSAGNSGDDKASYSYGEKEIWYMHSIETKNYVAVFELQDRDDGLGVNGRNGGQNPGQKLQSLKEIRLYTRQELLDKQSAAVPLKTIHFEYDYSLCTGIENNSNYDPLYPTAANRGKLTLKKVWFTYQGSSKGKLSPYEFTYADNDHNGTPDANFNYNGKSYDRWGNYKPNNPPSGFNPNSNNPNLLSSEFPYCEQDKATADNYASAWNLTGIKLPSGADIKVTYESDDYAFVQNKKAMEMHTLLGATKDIGDLLTEDLYEISGVTKHNHNHLYIKLSAEEQADIAAAGSGSAAFIRNRFFRDEQGRDIDYLYFKVLLNVERDLNAYTPKYEYVGGYAKIDFNSPPDLDTATNSLRLTLKEVEIYDNIPLSGQTTNPISMAGINFVRKYMPRVAYDNNQDPYTSFGSNLLGLLEGMKAAFTPIVQFFKGGLANALLLSNACQKFVPERSFVKLYSSRQFKKGGGSRVKDLILTDNWAAQSGNTTGTSTYGQTYDYVTNDNNGRVISSGVASYEPLIGGDENPFKKPVFYEEKNILAPDDDYYQEEPYGEALFPGASVGYSRIVVRNLERKNGSQQVSRHATGAVVHEFYTAKDFPTMTDRTDVKKERHKPNPVAKFLKFFVRDFMTTSQGFQVVLNDMHGKPKAQWVYKEADPALLTAGTALNAYYGNNYISGVEYKYHRNLDQLTNNVQVVNKSGQVATGMVGVDYDMVIDTRESQTTTNVGTTQGNLEGFFLAIFPALVPTMFPGYSREKVRYRSTVVTKVLYRYGLLDETIAYDNGASVKTKNKLWDAQTGEVVLTETVNNFDDPVYGLTYPAHWAYDRMGNASKNIGAYSSISGGSIAQPGNFITGDEVLFNNGVMGWVRSVLPTVQVIDNTGAVINLGGHTGVTVVRSGNRNQQNVPVAQVSSLVNPVVANALVLNTSSKVINAGAVEFKDDWSTFCNCGTTAGAAVNPYLTGQKGIWRQYANYAYLTARDQSKKNANTNIRKDGAYNTFIPYWTPNNTSTPYNWNKTTDPSWQYVTKTSIYSPYGFEIENVDALGRNSSAIYGYGNSLPIAVSSNAKYSQIAFDGFEDYDYNNPCDNSHFSYIKYMNGPTEVTYNKASNNYISKTPTSQNQKYSHSGRKSIKLTAGQRMNLPGGVNNNCTNQTQPVIHP